MEKNQNPEHDDKEQSQRFVETAKLLGVDENGESFESAFKTINPLKQVEVPAHPSAKKASA